MDPPRLSIPLRYAEASYDGDETGIYQLYSLW